MRIAVCIQNEETRSLLAELFQIYEAQNGYQLLSHFFKNDTELICELIGGEYDVIFFSDASHGEFISEIREKDRRVHLVRIVPAEGAIPDSGDVWYCLAEPLSRAFVFPVLDRLQSDAGEELDAGLLVKSRGSVMQLAFSRIEYVEVMGRTVFFHLNDGATEEVSGAFSDFENRLLNWPDFFKVHRSFIVNLRYVQKLEPTGILTKNGHSLPISKNLHSQFKKAYLCHMMDPEAKTETFLQSRPIMESSRKIGYSVLLVDDEEEELLRWREVLTAHGCKVGTAYSGESALLLAEQSHYDCVVLDVNLGDQCGFDLCAALIAATGAPVIFLSSLDDSESQTKGFLSGGIDYITKDATKELFWLKIEARIKMAISGKTELSDGKLRLNLKERKVFWQDQEVALTAVEFELLLLLMQSPGEVFTPARLYEVIWGTKQWDGGQGIQLHLSLLGRKLVNICPQHNFIETVWGKGYRFVSMQKGKEGADEV